MTTNPSDTTSSTPNTATTATTSTSWTPTLNPVILMAITQRIYTLSSNILANALQAIKAFTEITLYPTLLQMISALSPIFARDVSMLVAAIDTILHVRLIPRYILTCNTHTLCIYSF